MPPAAEFYKWYADLTHAISSIISKKQPGGAGGVGARAAAARRAEWRQAAGRVLRKNAFELIASSFNVSACWGCRAAVPASLPMPSALTLFRAPLRRRCR